MLLLVGLIFLQTYAQKGMYVGGVFQAHNSWLLNEDDLNAGDELIYTFTPGIGAGMHFGYQLNKHHAVEAQFIFAKHGQRYKTYYLLVLQNYIESPSNTIFTQLNYFKIPLLWSFGLNLSPKAVLRLYSGPELFLLTKDRDIIISSKKSVNVRNGIHTILSGVNAYVRNYDYCECFCAPNYLDSSPYKNLLFGWKAGIGISYKINSLLAFDLMIRGEYTFGDVENKNSNLIILYANSTKEEKYWNKMPKFFYNSYGEHARPATSLLSVGLNLGITYFIPKK